MYTQVDKQTIIQMVGTDGNSIKIVAAHNFSSLTPPGSYQWLPECTDAQGVLYIST